jgi:hypothetical protein
MSEKSITPRGSVPQSVLDLVPAGTGNIPEILEKLLAAAPRPLQAELREALKKAAILNPDDPVFDLVLVLELMSVYYQRTAAVVVKAGADIDASLTDRVRKLQGLAQLIEQATDKLEGIDQEIVKRFPVEWIVQQVVKKMDAQITTLPLTSFEEKMRDLRGTIHTSANTVENSSGRIAAAATDLENAAKKIEAVKLPRISIGWAVLWLVIGAALTGFAFSVAISRSLPEAKRVLPFVHTDETGMKIVVPKGQYQTATQGKDDGDVTIYLNP